MKGGKNSKPFTVNVTGGPIRASLGKGLDREKKCPKQKKKGKKKKRERQRRAIFRGENQKGGGPEQTKRKNIY